MKKLFLLMTMMGAALLGQGSAASPDELVKQIFTALAQKDSAALQQLSISQDEFKQFVWPGIPAPPVGNKRREILKNV